MSHSNRQRVLDFLGGNLVDFATEYQTLTDIGDDQFDETVKDLFDPQTVDGRHVFELAGLDPEEEGEEEDLEEEDEGEEEEADDDEEDGTDDSSADSEAEEF